MRPVIEAHEVTDLCGESLANHVHQHHHCSKESVELSSDEELDLLHADDHDDLRRGCG